MRPIVPALLLAAGSVSAAPGYSFVLTSGNYDYNQDLLAAVQGEFGANATVADFTDLKAAYDNDPQGLLTVLGGVGPLLWYNGDQYFTPTRGYFLAIVNGNVPGGWLVHGEIANNTVIMGSYAVTGAKVLAYAPVPEPSTYGLALGALALGVAAIRRRKKVA